VKVAGLDEVLRGIGIKGIGVDTGIAQFFRNQLALREALADVIMRL